VVSAGFAAEDALARAELRATALDDLQHDAGEPFPLPGESSPAGPRRGRLRLADPPARGGRRVAATGVLSGERCLLPAGAVWPGWRPGQAGPAVVGVVDDPADMVSSAIADILAHDLVTRWWGHPHIPLLRVTRRLSQIITPGALGSAAAMGLRVAAFVLPGSDFQIAIVALAGRQTTIGVAAGRLAASATAEAFLRALAALMLAWHGAPLADSVAALAAPGHRQMAWRSEAGELGYLERSAIEADLTQSDELAFWEGLPDWAGIAHRRYGHEPVVYSASRSRHATKVICPGAACYRPGTVHGRPVRTGQARCPR
jgi:hypothetical protein